MLESIIGFIVITVTTVLIVGAIQNAMENANNRLAEITEHSVPFPPAVTECVEDSLNRHGMTAESYLTAYADKFPRPKGIDYELQACVFPMIGGDDPTYDPLAGWYIDQNTGEWRLSKAVR
jgi:hypothetical protein